MAAIVLRMVGSSRRRSPLAWLILVIILLVLFPSENAQAQSAQVWLEGDVHKQLGKNWKYKGTPNFRKLAENESWSRIGLSNTFSRKLYPWFTANVGVNLFYTADPVFADMEEIRPWLATKFIYPKFIGAIHLEKPYVSVKLEERFLWYPDEGADDQKTRLRVKIGGVFVLNNTKLTDKTFYMPVYVEDFHDFDGAAFERDASRGRISIGLGYVFNPKWRGEFDFIAQDSLAGGFSGAERTDNIFQLKFDYYFGK